MASKPQSSFDNYKRIASAMIPLALVLAVCATQSQLGVPSAASEPALLPVDDAKVLSIGEAEALARRDEMTLEGEMASRFHAMQLKATGSALVRCGVNDAGEAAGLMVVMRLNNRGEVAATWLNNPSVLGQCFARELKSAVLPTDGRPVFYAFIHLNY